MNRDRRTAKSQNCQPAMEPSLTSSSCCPPLEVMAHLLATRVGDTWARALAAGQE